MPWQIICNDAEILAIHAALLPIGNRGQVVLFGGDEHNSAQAGRDGSPADPAQVNNTRIHDLDNNPGGVITVGSPTTDVFCSSHAFLGDGRLIIGGGTESWEGGGGPGGGHDHGLGNFGGHVACWVFNFRRRSWQRVADFNFTEGTATGEGQGGGRWYPTLLTLPSGEVIAFSGHPSRRSRQWHNNNIPEIYSPASNTWRRLSAHTPIDFYPRYHLIRNNQLFFATAGGNTSNVFDVNSGTFTSQMVTHIDGEGGIYDGWDNTSVLLPLLPSDNYLPRVLMCNGTQPIRIDLDTSPAWQNAGTRPSPAVRKFAIATLLPNGKVVCTGGVEDADVDIAVAAEIYDPGIDWATGNYTGAAGTWTAAEVATVPRNYHSTALLLPDGSVWTAGSSKGADAGDPAVFGEKRIEIFEPDYFSNAGRPDLTNAPTSIDYASSTFVIRTPQRNQIQRVALIRCGSCTHAGNFDQRYVALNFDNSPDFADGLVVSYPTDASILPPGYYMCWIVNNAGLPCKNAKFIRVAMRGAHMLLDHSTYSSLEVEALLSAGVVARFSKALFVVLDGFISTEVSGTPTIQLFYDTASGPAVPGVTIELNGAAEFEQTPPPDDAPQRITFGFDVVFNNMNPFSTANLPLTDRTVVAVARFGNHIAQGALKFTRNPNPYMTDGSVEWLSTDVRVFKIRFTESRAGITHAGNANQFIRDLLGQFNSLPDTSSHPFNNISTDIEASSLELAGLSGWPPFPVFNYAVAKVRYRSLSTPAPNVQVFFRMFQAATTDVSYNENTLYRRSAATGDSISLLGKFGSTIASIPFFADERINSSSLPMTSQTDATNKKTLQPNGAAESITYFGCWLDINQTTPQYPLIVPTDGPFTTGNFSAFNPLGRMSIQQLMRGTHQCLVAEVRFDPDPIPFGATPGSNDNLSQRNVVFDHSDNPGSPDSHVVRHTFELKPTPGGGIFSAPYANAAGFSGLSFSRVSRHPDELMIHWGTLPRSSSLLVYIPGVQADDILELQRSSRVSTSKLEKVDEFTIRCEGAADITYLPIPPTGKLENIPGLFTVELPNNVVKGQIFHAVIQQVEGSTRRIIGTFQLTIPVQTAEMLLPVLSSKYSVLKHIQLAVLPSDRWYAVFNRYVKHFGDKIKALGGNPDAILPSSSGSGKPDPGEKAKKYFCTWIKTALIILNIVAAILCLIFLFSGFSSMVIFSTVSVLCIINLILLLLWFYRKC
jgi:hypothetical protein